MSHFAEDIHGSPVRRHAQDPTPTPRLRSPSSAIGNRARGLVAQRVVTPNADGVRFDSSATGESYASRKAAEDAEITFLIKSRFYLPEYAEREATGKPFTRDDIAAHTSVDEISNGVLVTSFQQSRTDEAFRLVFANEFFEDGRVSMNMNYRNSAIVDFYATDVFRAQWEAAQSRLKSRSDSPSSILRHGIDSESGRAWLERCGNVAAKRTLNVIELTDFLTNTVNGRSTARIASDLGTRVDRGTLIPEDGSFSVELRLAESVANAPKPKRSWRKKN